MPINTNNIKVKTTIGNSRTVNVKTAIGSTSKVGVIINQSGSTINGNRLDALVDVDASNEVDGATLVYNSENDKYEVKQLDLSSVAGDLDAGTF